MKDWREFKNYLETRQVIDTHEHFMGITKPEDNIFSILLQWYVNSDLENAAGKGGSLKILMDEKIALDTRIEIFLKYFEQIKFTGYADSFIRGMNISWGIDITSEGLCALNDRKNERTKKFHDDLIDNARIKAGICDVFDIFDILNEGFTDYADWCRFAISTPSWHNNKNKEDIRNIADKMSKGSDVTSLNDYEEAMDSCVKRCVENGKFAAFKNQSAYERKIDFKNPTKNEAETVFNKIMSNPRYTASSDEVLPLSDYLYHTICRLAEKYDLPFQNHTGHLAGLYNNVTGANAAHLTSIIEMYQNVTFDLFHGNWPYMGDYLFLGKNYPNVTLDLCWLHTIDPDYAIELVRRIILTMPTTHVMAYGGDTGAVEHQIGALDQARENVARALCSLIDDGKIDEDSAKKIADDWFFNNPNRVFKLGL